LFGNEIKKSSSFFDPLGIKKGPKQSEEFDWFDLKTGEGIAIFLLLARWCRSQTFYPLPLSRGQPIGSAFVN
jgi:hypothetical protein